MVRSLQLPGHLPYVWWLSLIGWATFAHESPSSVNMQLLSPSEANVSTTQLSRMDASMQDAINKGRLHGIQVLLARHGKPFHFKTFGWQDRENDIPLQENSIFRIYSMTKPIVSVAMMMLFEEGRIQLSDPVGDYLPGFHTMKVYEDESTNANLKRPVTIRDLLTHTSGLTKASDDADPVDLMYKEAKVPNRRISSEELLERLYRIPLVSQPGEIWRYSVATDVAGCLVSTVTGKSLGKALTEMIFEPLGMVDTAFQVPAEDLSRLTVNYRLVPSGELAPMPGPESDPVVTGAQIESGGGGLVSTAADYYRFSQMLMNGGTLDGIRILGRHTLRYMTSNHLQPGISPIGDMRNAGNAYGFGLGFRVLMNPGLHAHLSGAGEFGWIGVANTYFWIDPIADLLGIFMSQLMPAGDYDLPLLFQSQAYASLKE